VTTSYVAADDLPTETMTEPEHQPKRPGRRRPRMGNLLLSVSSTVGLIALFTAFCEIGVRTGLWSESVLPAP
jgi:NitT/TauT family transport system permease protein